MRNAGILPSYETHVLGADGAKAYRLIAPARSEEAAAAMALALLKAHWHAILQAPPPEEAVAAWRAQVRPCDPHDEPYWTAHLLAAESFDAPGPAETGRPYLLLEAMFGDAAARDEAVARAGSRVLFDVERLWSAGDRIMFRHAADRAGRRVRPAPETIAVLAAIVMNAPRFPTPGGNPRSDLEIWSGHDSATMAAAARAPLLANGPDREAGTCRIRHELTVRGAGDLAQIYLAHLKRGLPAL